MDEGRGFTIIDYEDRYKQALEDISLPWLLEYDLLEPVDLEMLAEPHRFLSGGGRVLLARWGEEIVGMVMLELQGKGVIRISSSALGKSMGLTASQIRQDLFCFGEFGQQG